MRLDEFEFDSSLIGPFELEEFVFSEKADLKTEFEGIMEELLDPFRDSSTAAELYIKPISVKFGI